MTAATTSALDRPWSPGRLVYLLFLLSGATGLIYEVSWSRQVGLAVGHTASSAALVLAGYFAGMALGQLLGTQLASRWPPLLGYGVAELAVAAWAWLIPALLAWVGLPGSDARLDGWRAFLCFVVLLPATIPLGATFPLVAEHLSADRRQAGRRIALAYALNTAGGLAGIIAAATLLIVVGVRASSILAAGVSAAVGLAACALAAFPRPPQTPVESFAPAPSRTEPRFDARGWRVLAALSGFGTLGLEVLYTRMFALVFHNSTYTFAAVLAVFLAGLALGGALVATIGRGTPPRTLAAIAGSCGAAAVAGSVVLFVALTGLDYFSAGKGFAGYLGGVFGLMAAVVLLPITLLGMALPAAFVAAGNTGSREAGRLAALNTTAAAAGALVTGFVLMPSLGLWGAFGLHCLLLGLAGTGALLRRRRGVLAGAASLAIAAAAVVTLAPAQAVRRGSSSEGVVRRWESAYGWVDVVRDGQTGVLAVRQNIHYRHGSTANATREYRQGRLPLLLHPRPAEVAFLGLGAGLTAGAAVADRDVNHAVVVELIPEVVAAARLLADANLGVADHAKVQVSIDDARHYLSRTDRQFDVIVADLFVPWESRAAYSYTVEYYELVRRRLRPGGHFCQWLALYQVGPEEFELIADSFAAVFPQTTLWWGQFDQRFGIVALLGSDLPLEVDAVRLDERWRSLDRLPAGADPDLNTAADVPSLYLGRWPLRGLRRLNTDEHPWLEFSAPIHHRTGTLTGDRLRAYFDEVLALLPVGGVRFSGFADSPKSDPARWRALQRLSLFRPEL